MVSGGPDGCGGRWLAGPPAVQRIASPVASGGPEGERVEVVGEDRPGGPGAGAGVAFEAGSVEAVASLEVTDAAFGADAELGQPAVGLAAVGGVAAADEQSVGFGQVLADGAGCEAAVECDLTWPQVELAESLAGGGQQLGLVERTDAGAGRQDQAAGAAARVLAELGELHDVAELGRLAQLACADRGRVGVADGDQPIGDRSAREPQLDLRADLLGQFTEPVEPLSGSQLDVGAAPAVRRAQPCGKPTRFADGLGQQLAGLTGQPQRQRLAVAGACRERAVQP